MQELNSTKTSNATLYYGVAGLIGLLTALLGTLFHTLVDFLQANLVIVPTHLGLSGWQSALFLGLVSALMLCSAVALVRHFAPEASGSGVQEVEGGMAGVRQIRSLRVLCVKFFGGLLSLGAGLVGGREGPTIHMGAAIAQALVPRGRFLVHEARALLGAGAAAGLTAAFSSPVAAVLFVIEEARDAFPFRPRTYYAVILASAASAWVTVLVMGRQPFMVIHAIAPALSSYPLFIILGLVLGALGVAFNRLVLQCLDYARQVSVQYSPYLWPALLGLAVGALLYWLPEATGGGESLIERLVQQPMSVGVLGLLALARLVMTLTSYAAGTPAGIFAPILALATVVSIFLGQLLLLFFHLPDELLLALAVAGMAGLFASTVRAPLVGVVLIVELTGAYSLALPSLLCVMSSSLVAERLGGRPLYEQLLERTLNLAKQKRVQ